MNGPIKTDLIACITDTCSKLITVANISSRAIKSSSNQPIGTTCSVIAVRTAVEYHVRGTYFTKILFGFWVRSSDCSQRIQKSQSEAIPKSQGSLPTQPSPIRYMQWSIIHLFVLVITAASFTNSMTHGVSR